MRQSELDLADPGIEIFGSEPHQLTTFPVMPNGGAPQLINLATVVVIKPRMATRVPTTRVTGGLSAEPRASALLPASLYVRRWRPVSSGVGGSLARAVAASCGEVESSRSAVGSVKLPRCASGAGHAAGPSCSGARQEARVVDKIRVGTPTRQGRPATVGSPRTRGDAGRLTDVDARVEACPVGHDRRCEHGERSTLPGISRGCRGRPAPAVSGTAVSVGAGPHCGGGQLQRRASRRAGLVDCRTRGSSEQCVQRSTVDPGDLAGRGTGATGQPGPRGQDARAAAPY